MSVELQALEDAVCDFERNADLACVDPGRFSRLIDRLQGLRATILHRGRQRGDHMVAGRTSNAWVAQECRLMPGAAATALCVGEQLESMPKVAEALSSGEIGFQPAAVICNLRSRLREDLRSLVDEEYWIRQAREHSVKNLHWLEQHVCYLIDPDSFDHQVEEDWEKRFLSISPSGGMFHLTGVLDREAGSALETAIQGLSKPRGADDQRSPRQRRADALSEIVHHALDKGTLPKHHGVRPHVSVSTTLEGLKRELGAPASTLDNGIPVSSKTVQRLACDGTLHRILKSDSRVVDIGRARRTAQPAQWKALKARHQTCAWPGCDRPLSWTNAHHIEFWANGGKTDLHKLIPLCWYHHRLVHEGGWQVVCTGGGVKFIAPDTVFVRRMRWGEQRFAA